MHRGAIYCLSQEDLCLGREIAATRCLSSSSSSLIGENYKRDFIGVIGELAFYNFVWNVFSENNKKDSNDIREEFVNFQKMQQNLCAGQPNTVDVDYGDYYGPLFENNVSSPKYSIDIKTTTIMNETSMYVQQHKRRCLAHIYVHMKYDEQRQQCEFAGACTGQDVSSILFSPFTRGVSRTTNHFRASAIQIPSFFLQDLVCFPMQSKVPSTGGEFIEFIFAHFEELQTFFQNIHVVDYNDDKNIRWSIIQAMVDFIDSGQNFPIFSNKQWQRRSLSGITPWFQPPI